MVQPPHPVTPDKRYFVVRGRLWRASNPALGGDERAALVKRLMDARSAVGHAKRAGDASAEASARRAVDTAKRALGERGSVWWTDGAPDLNRHMAKNTPYAEWYAKLQREDPERSAEGSLVGEGGNKMTDKSTTNSPGRKDNAALAPGEAPGLVSEEGRKETGKRERRSAGPDGPDARAVGDTFKKP